MKIFTRLYDWVLSVSARPRAKQFLGVLSFAESSFFPIPPDVMLMPMSVANPSKWFSLALLTTITSVLGGLLGYVLGVIAIDSILPIIEQYGYTKSYYQTLEWFENYGVLIVFLAGVTPIPYKIFTIASGAFGVNLIGFIVMSLLGRGVRFFLVAFLSARLGTIVANKLRKYFDWIGWFCVGLIVVWILY